MRNIFSDARTKQKEEKNVGKMRLEADEKTNMTH